MKKLLTIPTLLAGFIGGVTFIASCGGSLSNEARASGSKNQLFCERRDTTLINDAFVGVVSATVQSLDCIDSSGSTYYRTDLAQLYSEGWRVQLISEDKEYVFSK